MPKKSDTDRLKAALLDLESQHQAVDRKIAEIRRRLLNRGRRVPAAQAKQKPPALRKQPDRVKAKVASPPLAPVFENRAGHYELIRVEADRAYYSFTNRQGKTVDAMMPVIMWQRMQTRAGLEDGRGPETQP